MVWRVPEQYRRVDPAGRYFSRKGDPYGLFIVPSPDKSRVTRADLYVIASPGMDGIEWEHVSARVVKQYGKNFRNFTPTWDEMCFIKGLFWGDEDCVVQFHPPKSDYVNVHENVLHLYRPTAADMPRPPKITV